LEFLFKRQVKWHMFFYAFSLCCLLNIDTFKIYTQLTNDSELRKRTVIMGANFANVHFDSIKTKLDSVVSTHLSSLEKQVIDSIKTTHGISNLLKATQKNLQTGLHQGSSTIYGNAYDLIGWTKSEWNHLIGLPIGLSKSTIFFQILFKILGLLISAFALMYGAPFWHEYLKSMLAVKNVINPKSILKK
jgi:hypothetical protein